MTSSNFAQDGGFSIGISPTDGASASVVNPLITPGVLNFPASSTDKSSGLTGEMIASCEDPAGSAARLFVSSDTDQDGRFFSADSTGTLTMRGSEDTSHNYVQGKTDAIGYKGEAYVTSDTTIVRWQQPATINTSFYDLTSTYSGAANVPHPALVFEDNAFYGNGNILLRQTSAGGTPATILSLPSNQVIIALGIDPGSGKMLISVVDQYNLSGTINSQPRVLYYDGFSNKASKVVLVDSMITAFYNVGSTVFIGYGQKLGYWNGAGIEFLRSLDIGLINTQLLYKHRFTNIGDILYIVEKNRILAFGEIMRGQGRSFWYLLENLPSGVPGTILSLLVNLGSNLLSYSYATSQFFTLDISSTATINGFSQLYTLRYDFPRPVTFNNVVLDYVSALPASTLVAAVYLKYDNAGSQQVGSVNAGSETKTTFECPYPTIETRSIQILYTALAVAPLERMTIFYTPKE